MQKTGPAGWLTGSGAPRPTGPKTPMPTPMPAPMPMPTPVPVPTPKPPMECAKGSEVDMVLAMSYVKMQKMTETYEPETALDRGTIFPELDLPFVGEGACPHNE